MGKDPLELEEQEQHDYDVHHSEAEKVQDFDDE